jgi:hypothetical protein
METTITLQELATKLNGRFWSKDGKERVYLEEGYNTKKMKTTTYVEVRNNEFVVRCFIDCPSQNDNWIKSQENEVIQNVENKIEKLTTVTDSEEVLFAVFNNKLNSFVDDCGTAKELNQLYEEDVYKTEKRALSFINERYESDDLCVKPIIRKDIE